MGLKLPHDSKMTCALVVSVILVVVLYRFLTYVADFKAFCFVVRPQQEARFIRLRQAREAERLWATPAHLKEHARKQANQRFRFWFILKILFILNDSDSSSSLLLISVVTLEHDKHFQI